MTTTAQPIRLPKLDLEQIEAEERRLVTDRMRTALTPEARLRLARTIVEEAVAEAPPALREQRDAAALTLSLYDGMQSVHEGVGLSRAYFHDKRVKALALRPEERGTWLYKSSHADVVARAEANGVPRVDGAEEVAVRLGDRIVRADVRARIGRAFRDTAVEQLLAQGWERRDIAAAGGIDASRVSQIKSAAKTRG